MILGDLEQAIMDRILAVSGTGDGKLGYALHVDGYGGEFDSEADLARAALKFPCALVLLKEIGEGVQVGGGQKVPIAYTIFVGAKNRRNAAARRRGAVGAVGSYQMMWDIRKLLDGQMLGFDDQIDGLCPGAVTSVINGRYAAQPISVYACTFTTIWYEDRVILSDDILGEFLELDVAWDVPPLGNVTPPLPAAEADARDTIHPRDNS